MNINQYLQLHKKIQMIGSDHYEIREKMARIVCQDGFAMYVQVSDGHFCRLPCINDVFEYSAVEVGFPNMKEDLLMPFADDETKPTDTVYGYVPIGVVDKVIEKHGGFADNASG